MCPKSKRGANWNSCLFPFAIFWFCTLSTGSQCKSNREVLEPQWLIWLSCTDVNIIFFSNWSETHCFTNDNSTQHPVTSPLSTNALITIVPWQVRAQKNLLALLVLVQSWISLSLDIMLSSKCYILAIVLVSKHYAGPTVYSKVRAKSSHWADYYRFRSNNLLCKH